MQFCYFVKPLRLSVIMVSSHHGNTSILLFHSGRQILTITEIPANQLYPMK